MDLQAILEKAEKIASLFNRYESGDLMLLSDTKELYSELYTLLLQYDSFKNLSQFVKLLIESIEKMTDPALENEIAGYLKESHTALVDLFGKKKPQKEIAQTINEIIKKLKIIQKNQSAKNQALHKNTKTYPPDYFANIVQDKKMLAQLCDEITDHMDKAQYTLVDIEYDDTNPENLNKIFRSFHTIKGSSAFLGLKNIEDVSHEMENLLVLVRDGKLRITSELIDVIFFGIEMLRNIVSIMTANEFDIPKMVESFKKLDIFSYINLIKKILEQYQIKKIGVILEEEGRLHQNDVVKILEKQRLSKKKFGEIAVEEKFITEKELENAIKKQAAGARKTSYVRVSNDRLNLLVDTVGELVINQSMLKQIINDLTSEEAKTNRERVIAQLEGITTNIKNIVLSMGMVPIADIFNKLRVVIRNTAQELGKTVIVEIKGEDTELDRNVIEAIYDPLVHIVRNSVDHGIESAEEREKAKKDRVGKIIIAAEHKGNGIEISVSDDGRGIQKDKIIKKALEMGLISEEKINTLVEKEVYQLMFLPGFSTADKVTEVSGRGVGLDVVKKNIEEIRGKIEIQSKLGSYTRFIIKLPLTLAIIEGFVTSVGENKYIFPFNLVEEIIVPEKKNLTQSEDGTMMLFHRGNYIPVIFSGQVFNEKKYNRDIEKMIVIIILHEGRYYGIVVDRVIGKQETVIKNLSEILSSMITFSGGTIFGDGTIGFVVDIDGFLEKVKMS